MLLLHPFYLQIAGVQGRVLEAHAKQSAIGTERRYSVLVAVLTDAVHCPVKWGLEGERPDYLPPRVVGTRRVAPLSELLVENVLQVLFRDLVKIDQISQGILLTFDVDLGHCCEVLL